MAEAQYLQSKGIPEVQYFDGRVGGEVNKTYSNIINSDPIKCPWFQQSYLEELAINANEKGDKDFCFLRKRKGFDKITIDAAFDGYEFVDSVGLNGDGCEYFLALNYKRDKLKIGKLCESVLHDVTAGFYGFGFGAEIPFKEGLSERLTKTYFPGGERRKIFTGTTIQASAKGIKRYTEEIGYYLTDTAVDNHTRTFDSGEILPGDYIYLIRSGEVGQVTTVEPDRLRIDGVRRMVIADTNAAVGEQDYVIFPSRIETFIFQTLNGPIQYHSTNDGIDMFPAGSLYGGNLEISSMDIYQDNIYFIDKKSGRLYYGSNGIQQLVVGSNQYADIGYKYNRIVSYLDYIVLYGPNAIGAAYGTYIQVEKNNSTFNLKWQDLLYNLGAWSESAIFPAFNSLQFVGSDGTLYSLGIQAVGTYTGSLSPNLQPQSYYIVDDIHRLNRDDVNINLYIEHGNIYIFITNKTYPVSGNKKQTKVLIYDYFFRFRRKRYIEELHINKRTLSGYYYGLSVYTNDGDTDDGNDITQLISLSFGEQTLSSQKYFTTSKFILGQDTTTTKGQSEIRFRFDSGGRSNILSFDNLGSSQYISNLMHAKDGGTIEKLPDGTDINPGNGVPEGLITNFNNEFFNFKNFEISMDTKLAFNDNDQLAKWGKIKFDIAKYSDTLYLEIIARGKDRIEFGGLLLGFSQTDIDTERLGNVLGVEN